MSTKLTKADEKSNVTENPDAKSEPMSGSCQPLEASAIPKPPAGKSVMTVMTVMTAEETANLLARLQDILSMWPGSDSKVIGGFVMTAFPIPPVMTVGKQAKKNGHDKVFSVNDIPVVSLD
jgi:hypothetical protein